MPDLPQPLLRRLRSVRSAGVVTGAGISVESGIGAYRGKGGLYDDPEEGDRTVEALSGPTLRADPDRTWRVIARLVAQASAARPNAAHLALARLDDLLDRCVILTQNVDRLHREAGSRNLIEIHGDVFRSRCTGCDRVDELDVDGLSALGGAPRCRRCSATLRPDVVLFEELLPARPLAKVRREFHERPPDLVLVVGTTGLFPYISAPVTLARAAGRLTVEVNPERTAVSDEVEFALRGEAGAWVPELVEALARS